MKEKIQYLYRNCFLLFIPVILINILSIKYLPEYYLKNIPHAIVYLEIVVRIILMALSAVMIIDIKDRVGKTGVWIYAIGLAMYIVSYVVIINFPDTSIGKSMIVQLSGYWTATIWLIGIGLIGKRLFVKMPYHYSCYVVLSILFGMIHTYHGYLLMFIQSY